MKLKNKRIIYLGKTFRGQKKEELVYKKVYRVYSEALIVTQYM